MINFNQTCGFGYDHAASKCPYEHIHDEIDRLHRRINDLEFRFDSCLKFLYEFMDMCDNMISTADKGPIDANFWFDKAYDLSKTVNGDEWLAGKGENAEA